MKNFTEHLNNNFGEHLNNNFAGRLVLDLEFQIIHIGLFNQFTMVYQATISREVSWVAVVKISSGVIKVLFSKLPVSQSTKS